MNTPLKRGLVLVLALMASQCTSPAYANTQKLLTATANTGNNAPQELRKLLTTVEHRTIADVFLCPSFFGVVSHTHAIAPLWWGGHGNKPFTRRIPCAVLLRFSNLPTALYLGQSSQYLPFEKV